MALRYCHKIKLQTAKASGTDGHGWKWMGVNLHAIYFTEQSLQLHLNSFIGHLLSLWIEIPNFNFSCQRPKDDWAWTTTHFREASPCPQTWQGRESRGSQTQIKGYLTKVTESSFFFNSLNNFKPCHSDCQKWTHPFHNWDQSNWVESQWDLYCKRI